MTSGETKSKVQNQCLYHFHRKLQRWHKIVTVVGWVGIFLGHMIPATKITDSTDADFDKFLGNFCLQRPKILELVERHWPDAPGLIKLVGCIYSSFVVYSLTSDVAQAELPKLLDLDSSSSSSSAQDYREERDDDEKYSELPDEITKDVGQMNPD